MPTENLVKIFEENITEDTIDIRVEELTDDDVGEMVQWLDKTGRDWTALHEVDLGNNKITKVANVTKLLKKAVNVRDVDLRENGFGKDKMEIYNFQDTMQIMTNVVELSLNGCQLWDYGAEVICENAATMKTLRKLHLVDNFLSAAAGPHVAKLVKKNTKLQELYLDYNKLHDAGCSDICKALMSNTNLMRIGLGDNGISDDGCLALRDLWKSNKSGVKIMDLSVNDIQPKGCQYLSEGLAHNTTLLSVDLGANREMCDNGAIALTRFLTTNKTLRKLDLTNINMTNASFQDVYDSMSANRTLTDLMMLLNEGLDMENKEKIARIFVANRELREDQLLASPKQETQVPETLASLLKKYFLHVFVAVAAAFAVYYNSI
eukprot:TRINITY_DN5790_c0_g1_i1.p1 TRINITY_DN5790_c0_g1~~TRINITY_DN5790_c0_g1_i1.p1  ORF type:complete len:377 (+),score=73.87 TRINITY_DN5790_c0_g1_i1:69-1199(+)